MQVWILKTCDVNRNSDCNLRSSVALLSDWLYLKRQKMPKIRQNASLEMAPKVWTLLHTSFYIIQMPLCHYIRLGEFKAVYSKQSLKATKIQKDWNSKTLTFALTFYIQMPKGYSNNSSALLKWLITIRKLKGRQINLKTGINQGQGYYQGL